jgi:pre-mRNA-splicing factor 18
VIRRLRDRSEPILLYGETEDEAKERLKKLELENTEISVGLKNDPK